MPRPFGLSHDDAFFLQVFASVQRENSKTCFQTCFSIPVWSKNSNALFHEDVPQLLSTPLHQRTTGSTPVRPTNSINDLGRSHQDPLSHKTCYRSVSGNRAAAFPGISPAGVEFFDPKGSTQLSNVNTRRAVKNKEGKQQLLRDPCMVQQLI